MKRATKTKRVKKTPTKIELAVCVAAPHTFTRLTVDVDKIKTKQMSKLLRQLADLVETGEFENEINKLAGVYGVTIPTD